MNGYQKYKEQSVYSMSQAEQLLLLFDTAITRLNQAEYALEDKDYGVFDESLTRVNRILRYLIDILDMNQPLGRDLRQIYHYLIYDIGRIKAGRERRADEIGRIRHILSELRGAFDEASRKVSAERSEQEAGMRG